MKRAPWRGAGDTRGDAHAFPQHGSLSRGGRCLRSRPVRRPPVAMLGARRRRISHDEGITKFTAFSRGRSPSRKRESPPSADHRNEVRNTGDPFRRRKRGIRPRRSLPAHARGQRSGCNPGDERGVKASVGVGRWALGVKRRPQRERPNAHAPVIRKPRTPAESLP